MTDPFLRAWAVHSVEGHTRVQWELHPRFLDPAPHRFRLEVAPCASPADADWAAVGGWATDAFYLVDDVKREFGKSFSHVWRVRLETPAGAYLSRPAGVLDPRRWVEWRVIREMTRQGVKRARLFTGVAVTLFKRKRYGADCATCVDPHTGEPQQSDCPECGGTGRTRGYHAGVTGLWADVGPEDVREAVDAQATGHSQPVVVTGSFFGFPAVDCRDVVAEVESGKRWHVERVTQAEVLRGHPVRTDAELRLLPFTDPAYRLEELAP